MATAHGALLVAFAALVSLSVFWLGAGFCQTCFTDYNEVYAPIARMLAGETGTLEGAFWTYYPPGYPLVLAGVFRFAAAFSMPEVWAIQALFAASTIGGALILFFIASEVWPQPAALVAPLAWITYPPALWLTKQPNSEVIYCPVLFGSMFLAITGMKRSQLWRLAGSGVLVGAAMLIRPIAIGVPVVLAIVILLLTHYDTFSRRLLGAALLVGTSMLVVLPWQFIVLNERGPWVPLAGVGAPSIVDGLTYDVNPGGGRVVGNIHDREIRALMLVIEARAKSARTLPDLARVIGEEARARPTASLELLLMKVARSWYGTDSHRYEGVTLPVQLLYLVLVAVSGRAAYRQTCHARVLVITVALTALYFWGMTITVLSILRYMTPTMALLFLFLPSLVDRSDGHASPIGPDVVADLSSG